jgi:hypothetical protein
MSDSLIYYDEFVQPVTTAKKIVRDENCNGYVVKNIGNTVCFINLDPLQPGEFRSMGGNRLEIYRGRIEIKFGAQVTDLADPPSNSAIVTQKFYLFNTPPPRV